METKEMPKEMEVQEATLDTASRKDRTDKIVKNHILGSMGVGLIPIPIVDLVALMGIQLDMIRSLANEYGIPFSKDIGKSTLTSLLGGILPVTFRSTIASMIKFIPLIGQTTAALTMPAISGGATYAVAKVFVQHFESGGTFLDFNPAKVKDYFAEQFKEGRKVAADMKKGAAAPAK